MNIREKYRDFLRRKVDSEILSKYENVTVLGENLVSNYYIILFEQDYINPSCCFRELRRYIAILNTKKITCEKLKMIPQSYGYIASTKFDILEKIPKEIYTLLIRRGLYLGEEVGYNTNNSYYLIHRLNLCLYSNILNLVGHHIDKIKQRNYITNLIPVKKEEHDYLDHFDLEQIKAKKIQKAFKSKVFKPKNLTLSSYDSNIQKILELKENGFSVKEIVKKLDNKIQKSCIYTILKEFFYRKDFLKYLKTCDTKPFLENLGISEERWKYIKEFDDL